MMDWTHMLYDTNPFSLWFCVAFGYYLYAIYVMHMTFTYKIAGWKVFWWPVVPEFVAFFSFTVAKNLKTCRKDILDPTDVTVSDVCLDDIDLALSIPSAWLGKSLKQPLLG
jgi:hypothetical protein